jgi:hypothetical protein
LNYSLQKIDYTLSFFLNAIAFSYHQGKRTVNLIREFWDTLYILDIPPEPIVTRWGTWLDAACYYVENLDSFKKIVLEFPESASEAIKDYQNVLKNKTLEQSLAFIKANYYFVSKAIKKLEAKELTVVEAIKVVENYNSNASKVEGSWRDCFQEIKRCFE